MRGVVGVEKEDDDVTANDEKRIIVAMHCHGDVKLDNVVMGGDIIDYNTT